MGRLKARGLKARRLKAGRLRAVSIPPVLWLAPLACLGACAAPARNAASLGATSQPPAPQNLIGSTPQVLDAEFGQPTLRRVDGTAQVWLYHSARCGLNLFLYPDAAGVPRVTMATTAEGSPAIGDCPASLAQSHIEALSSLPESASLPQPTAALEPPASS